MVDIMNRRGFLKSAMGGALMASIPARSFADENHALAGLRQLRVDNRAVVGAQSFEPARGAFYAVLPMTAAAMYPSCGAAVAGLKMASEEAGEHVQPVVLMVGPNDQAASGKENIDLMINQYPDIPVLTGDKESVLRAANAISQSLYRQDIEERDSRLRDLAANQASAPFSLNAEGRIDGHSVYAYLLNPEGRVVGAFYAEYGAGLDPEMFVRAIDECVPNWRGRLPGQCLG